MSFQELSSRERGGRDSLVSLDSIKVCTAANSIFAYLRH